MCVLIFFLIPLSLVTFIVNSPLVRVFVRCSKNWTGKENRIKKMIKETEEEEVVAELEVKRDEGWVEKTTEFKKRKTRERGKKVGMKRNEEKMGREKEGRKLKIREKKRTKNRWCVRRSFFFLHVFLSNRKNTDVSRGRSCG